MSVSVEYSTKEISAIVLTNVLKMCKRRELIDNVNSLLEKLKEDFVNKGIVEFKTKDEKKISVHQFTGKVASIVQGSPLDDYLKNAIDVHKILIMKEPTKRTAKQITSEYPNAEFFFEYEMMEDIPAKMFIPEHTLLSEEEKKAFLEIFKETELAKINDTDMMSRYYAAKLGDIFKITRPSLTAGKNIFYRKVVPGNVNQLFDY
jgi:DNA-directed RNA polymerase subunit H (RpoH/RPB5)